MAQFIPRTAFTAPASLPRSYFLGHHRAGLDRMKSRLSTIDLIIECRDYRVPISSQNPLFEDTLRGKQRLIVYTKRDLGSRGTAGDREREDAIARWLAPTSVLFSDIRQMASVRKVLDFAREHMLRADSLFGSNMMITGIPNVGKSSLLNALRFGGVGKGKVAQTGGQPGVTRKLGTSVKILDHPQGDGGTYLIDTPGVFVPYVNDPETMLKLALCGSVKDSIIPPTILADYLLYQLNLQGPELYKGYSNPTNEVEILLTAIATKTGRLQRGGVPDLEASAMWLIQRWRDGHFGKFVLDNVTEDTLRNPGRSDAMRTSITHARNVAKEEKRAISLGNIR